MATASEKTPGPPDLVHFSPTKDLTELGLYSYSSLTAYCLYKLYGGSAFDKDLVTTWTTLICQHNGQSPLARDTMIAVATGEVQLDTADPFVDAVRGDTFVTDNGAIVIIQDLLTLGLGQGCYDARVRTLIKHIALLLSVDSAQMEVFEERVVESLHDEEHVPTKEEQTEQKSTSKQRKLKRYALIGAAAVGGGALLGLTGGLAAPLIAAGAGAIIGTTGAAALGSVAGVAIIGSLFGVAGVGLGGYKMKKRVGGVEEFEFEPLSEARQLHVTIGVSGWISNKMPDFKTPWLGLANSKEQYVLKFETKYMKEMGQALEYLMDIAIKAATQEVLKYTVLSGLLTAIAWPAALLSVSSVIDNPWNVCTHRAVNVGRALADVLLSRQQGKRPVTLIGFSLGARVIFYCLKEMAKRKNCEGIVEDVILLGAPVTGNPKDWQAFSRVVAGKVVNGYCRGDWLLKFLYRTVSVQFSVAGLKAVPWHDRRMYNIDLSDVVEGHLDYMNKIDDILNVVGINTKAHPKAQASGSLKAWVNIQKSSSDPEDLKSTDSGRDSPAIIEMADVENTDQQADHCDENTDNADTADSNHEDSEIAKEDLQVPVRVCLNLPADVGAKPETSDSELSDHDDDTTHSTEGKVEELKNGSLVQNDDGDNVRDSLEPLGLTSVADDAPSNASTTVTTPDSGFHGDVLHN